jgi:urease accessory protein
LNLERVGRDGFLSLRFKRHLRATTMAHCSYTLPMQALAPVQLEDGSAYMLLLNPTGGVLGGDRLLTRIALERDTHVCLSTPSATRVYRTTGAPSMQETWIEMAEGATLEYVPDHVIPHAGSQFRQHLRLDMEAGGRAILFDAMAAGRLAHGERWKMTELDSAMEIFLRGKRVYLNRTRVRPSMLAPERFGLMEEFGYLASFVLIADGFDGWPEIIASMNETIAARPRVFGGASLLARAGCAVRLLAKSAVDLTDAATALWAASRSALLGLPPAELRKY